MIESESPAPTVIIAEAETPQEAALYAWFVKQQTKSVDNLETAARQMVTLCSTLLGLLLGLLALTETPPPAHILWSGVQWVGGIGVTALALSLAAALYALIPQALTTTLNDPDRLKADFAILLARKSRGVWWSAFLFGLGMFCLAAVVIIALTLLS